MNRYTRSIIGLFFTITIFLSADIYYKYQQFLSYHQNMSTKTMISTAAEIETLISSLNHQLKLFVQQEHTLLSSLYHYHKTQKHNSNKDEEHHQIKQQLNTLKNKIADYFPGYIEFTLADHGGNILLNQNSFKAYPLCRDNIKQAINSDSSQQPPLSLHSNPDKTQQHYDIMQTFKIITDKQSDKAIFFISYPITPLKKLLAQRQIKNHFLFIVNKQKPQDIEFTAFENNQQHIKSFTTNSSAILANKQYKPFRIKQTHWAIMDGIKIDFQQRQKNSLIIQHSFIALFFLLICALFLYIIRKESEKSSQTHLLLEGVENERKRISMDMHDHILADITHISRKIASKSHCNPQTVNKQLLSISQSIRDLIDDLHPNSLDLLGIEAALQSYINKHLSDTYYPDHQLTIDDQIEQQLKPYQKYTLFRIIVELINNIINHSQCSFYSVSGHINGSKIEFVIEDNGMGLQKQNNTTNASTHQSHGLSNINSRCQILGAKLTFENKIPQGTLTKIQLELINE